MSSVDEKIREILAAELQVDQARLLPEAVLRADLGMDSIAALNILFAAQETFGIEVEETEIAGITTVAEIARFIRERAALPDGGDRS